jgi:cation:H+ antiporter
VSSWILFAVCSFVVVLAAMRLAEYGDVIALRTGLGGMFVGTLLMAAATSLPELLTTINALQFGEPNLAAGNLLGSNMFNMLMLAILDMTHQRKRILRKAARKHALSGSLAVLMISLVVLFILADIPVQIGWVGGDSLVLIGAYLGATYLLQAGSRSAPEQRSDPPPGTLSLPLALFGFGLATAALIYVSPLLVEASVSIAESTGLGTTFVGTTLVALVTSLPEAVTTFAAARIGAEDMAIGNLFGSNMFNMVALGITDLFFVSGRLIGFIDPSFLLVAAFGLVMTALAVVGNVAKLETRILFVEVDAALLILLYAGGMWLLYTRGIGA